MIYVAEILDHKFVKIGFAADVQERLAALQTGNPFKINLVFAVDGTLRQEQTVHDALTGHFGRIHVPCPPNEWYPGKLPLIQKFIVELRISVSGAIAFADSCGVGNKNWFGGKQNNPKVGRHNGEPILHWPRL